jgi:hypothetical protein
MVKVMVKVRVKLGLGLGFIGDLRTVGRRDKKYGDNS